MKLYEQKELWRHGSKFIIRKLPNSHGTQDGYYIRFDWRKRGSRRNIYSGPYALYHNDRFVARLKLADVPKWIEHFAVTALFS